MKLKLLALNILMLAVCTSCSKKPTINEGIKLQVVESSSPIQTTRPTITAEANDDSYKFYDKSIEKTLEIYFDKTSDKFTTDDFASLEKLNYLVVEDNVESIEDISNLFPNLKYLSISADGAFSLDVLNTIANSKSLKALTLITEQIPNSDFANNLLYFEIKHPDTEEVPSKSNLNEYSVLDKSIIDKNFNRSINKFIRIIDNDSIYELVCSSYYKDESDEFSYKQERKIFVSGRNDEKFVLKSILDCSGYVGDAISNRIYLADVNFDEKKDILIDNGHFGNQGFVTFTCFLNINEQYEKCDSFSDIVNPSVDTENKKILSAWRNWAASHSWAMYSYDETMYIMTDCLTEEAVSSQDSLSQSSHTNKEVWKYTVEELRDGVMKEIESFTTNDYTDDEIDVKFFSENSFWGLSADKWRTLFNTGKMSDFSIYGNDSINDTILNIIGL